MATTTPAATVEALVKEAKTRWDHQPETLKPRFEHPPSQSGHTTVAAAVAALAIFGLAGGVALASSVSDNRTGPRAQSPLASPSAAAPLTPAASPTPTPSAVVPTGTAAWALNGATLKAGGAMAAELDTGGNVFAAQVSATKGAWTAKIAITGQGPLTLNGAISGPGPMIDLTVYALGFPIQLHGTPGKDLSVTFGPRTTSMLVADVRPAAAVPADTINTTATELGQGWLRTVAIFSLVGWIALLVAPGLRSRGRAALRSSPWRRLALGLILLLDIPLAMLLLVVLGVPLGVWWLGIIGLVLFIGLCLVGYAYSAFQLGALVMDRVWEGRDTWLLAVPFGVALIALVALLPYVGPVSILVAVVYGLGSMIYAPAEPIPSQLAAPAEAAALPAATSPTPASKPIVE